MMEPRCGMCGGELDDLAMCLTIELAPGRHGQNAYRQLPRRLEEWWICWECLPTPGAEAIRAIISDEYMEPMTGQEVTGCKAICEGGRLRRKRLFSLWGGAKLGGGVKRCPVCYGRAEVEIAGRELHNGHQMASG